ncbi:MAG: HNH endonuclease [Deltaproteobacteria bacterium]|nr:HNH endonuclease [Deltaproteobacteria bacterium]
MKRRPLSRQLRVQVLARDNYRCKMCGRTKDEVSLEVDHIKPIVDGGTDELDNLATLCRDCNRGKAAYRFSDYTSMVVVPDGIEDRFKFFHDDKLGDFEQYHFYLYYKEGIHSGPMTKKFHHTWRISGSKYDSSSDHVALENRRKAEEAQVFLKKIRDELISEAKRLG